MKIIARYALRNPKINTKCKIEPKGIIFCLEQTATGSATAVAAGSGSIRNRTVLF